MALYKQPRSSYWHYDVTIDGRRYRGSTRCETKTAAKAAEARLVLSIEEKGFAAKPKKSTTTLLAYIPRFEEWVEGSHQLRPDSKRFYRDGIKVIKRSALANVPLVRITEDLVDVTVFTNTLGGVASSHQSNQALSTLRRILNKARRWGDIADVPPIRLREAPGREVVITDDIEAKILTSLQTPEKHAAVRAAREAAIDVYLLMHDGGMRTSEAVSARLENIDWMGKRLFVPGGKSKRARRWVPLSDRLIARLRYRCHSRSEGWVFPSARSDAGHLKGPWRSFRAACRKAGVPDDILLYTGRHTFGTTMMQATGNVFAVSQAMGHQDIKSMRPYQHHDPALLGEAINQRLGSRHTLRHTELPVQ